MQKNRCITEAGHTRAWVVSQFVENVAQLSDNPQSWYPQLSTLRVKNEPPPYAAAANTPRLRNHFSAEITGTIENAKAVAAASEDSGNGAEPNSAFMNGK